MDLKHSLIFTSGNGESGGIEDGSGVHENVLLVKTEPRLSSPCSNGLTSGNLLPASTANLIGMGSNIHVQQGNGLVVTTLQATGMMSSNNLLLNNGLQDTIQMQQLQQNNGLSSNGTFSGTTLNQNISTSSSSVSLKRSRPDDWLNSSSPNTGTVNAPPPLTPSPGPPSHTYTVISNGYSSPMSSGSYDPYSPSGKLSKYTKIC